MTLSRFFIASSLLVCSCTVGGPEEVGPPDDPDDPADRTLHQDLLLAPIPFALEPRESAALVTASVFDGQSWQEHPTFLDLTSGAIEASRDLDVGLWLDRLELRFADVSLGPDAGPSGQLGLTDLLVSLEAPHPCDAERWTDGDDRVDAEVVVSLDLAWSLVTGDGTVVPLATQALSTSNVDLTLRRGLDGDQVGLSLVNPGVMWEWAGLLRIEGVMLSASGEAIEPGLD